MLSTSNIGELHLNREVQLTKSNAEREDAYNKLSFTKRKMFNRLNSLIIGLTNTIKDETGWDYVDGTFTKLTFFVYNGVEILYTVNTVTNNGNGYHLSDNPGEAELRLFNLYKDQLDKIAVLETRLKALYPPKDPQIISLQTNEALIRKTKEKNIYYKFLDRSAMDFEEEYGEMGITLLLRVLNGLQFDDDVLGFYEELVEEGITDRLLNDLFRLANLYDPRCIQVINYIDSLRHQELLESIQAREEATPNNIVSINRKN